MPMQVNQAAEPLYIVKPFSGKGIAGLFSTHPPIEERVKRLRQMRPSHNRLRSRRRNIRGLGGAIGTGAGFWPGGRR